MPSVTEIHPQKPEDSHYETSTVNAYCSGLQSNELCHGLTDDEYDIQWSLSTMVPFSHEHFKKELVNCILLIIVADLADKHELEKCYLMAKVGYSQKIPVLVFNISNPDWKNIESCPSFSRQMYLLETTNIFQLEGGDGIPYLSSFEKYKTTTADLLWKLRSVVGVIFQQFIGVDYNDILHVLSKKGLVQTSISCPHSKNEINLAIAEVKDNLASEDLLNAHGAIITLFTRGDITLDEFELITNSFKDFFVNSKDILVVFGVIIEPELFDKKVISITIPALQ